MGTTPEPFDDRTAAGGPTAVGTAAPYLPPGPSLLDRGRAALAGTTTSQVVGWVMVVGWVVWLVSLWVSQPRLVSQEFLADDLAQGNVTGYRVVTAEQGSDSFLSGGHRIDVQPANDADDGVVDDADNGQPLTVAYWVDAPVASLRVVDTNGLQSGSTAAVVAQLRSAGVPEADAVDLFLHPPAGRTYTGGSLLLGLTLLMVLIGPRPTRGTRWFWFWLLALPLGLAVPLFAVAERIRPVRWPEGTVHPSGVAGRWSGLSGFAASFLFSFVGAGVTMALSSVSPIWVIRG